MMTAALFLAGAAIVVAALWYVDRMASPKPELPELYRHPVTGRMVPLTTSQRPGRIVTLPAGKSIRFIDTQVVCQRCHRSILDGDLVVVEDGWLSHAAPCEEDKE